MKVAPVFAALAAGGRVEQQLVHTGQHYDSLLNDVFFAELPLPRPDVQLEIGSGTHGEQTARALVGLERHFLDVRPDLVLVPGDVNSTLAGALAAAKLDIDVCHLEAGLRSFDRTMPEEHNRRLTDHVATLLLTPSADADANLQAEGIDATHVRFVGNTMIDTLLANVDRARERREWSTYGLERGRYVLVTLHRPGLVDDPELLTRTITALGRLASRLPVILPVHPRTARQLSRLGVAASDTLQIVEPLPYTSFLSLHAGAAAVVTDSGGIQEEATALGIPCFTLRANTERPITVTHGTNTVLGLEPERIASITDGLDQPREPVLPPLWDGHAGERSAAAIVERLV